MVSVGLFMLLLVEYRIVYVAEFLKMHIDLVMYSYMDFLCSYKEILLQNISTLFV